MSLLGAIYGYLCGEGDYCYQTSGGDIAITYSKLSKLKEGSIITGRRGYSYLNGLNLLLEFRCSDGVHRQYGPDDTSTGVTRIELIKLDDGEGDTVSYKVNRLVRRTPRADR